MPVNILDRPILAQIKAQTRLGFRGTSKKSSTAVGLNLLRVYFHYTLISFALNKVLLSLSLSVERAILRRFELGEGCPSRTLREIRLGAVWGIELGL